MQKSYIMISMLDIRTRKFIKDGSTALIIGISENMSPY